MLPRIPWGRFLHVDSSQLANQFLAASANRFSEFGEGAAASQGAESVLSGAAVLSTGPGGTTVAWRTERRTSMRTHKIQSLRF